MVYTPTFKVIIVLILVLISICSLTLIIKNTYSRKKVVFVSNADMLLAMHDTSDQDIYCTFTGYVNIS